MSFFFDVWTTNGFVLASDVRLKHNGQNRYLHKLRAAPNGGAIHCAMASCGEYCEVPLNHFSDAALRKDTLRDIAQAFAEKWVHSFAGTENYSAVHLVGYEPIPGTTDHVPQMWFWCNWVDNPERYLSEPELVDQLESFSEPIPHNNHIPARIRDAIGSFPGSSLAEERDLVTAYLGRHQPHFTWNGDNIFWRSAAHTVSSIFNLLRRSVANSDLEVTADLTRLALEFLARIGSFQEDSTVALSPQDDCDILLVTPSGVQKKLWSNLPDDTDRNMEYPVILTPVDEVELELPSGDSVAVRRAHVVFEKWPDDDMPEDTYNGKEVVVDVKGDRAFGELAVLRLFQEAGWDGVWVDTYRNKYRTGYWGPNQEVELSREHQELLSRMPRAGCWDVFCWKDDVVVFAESKRRKKDRFQATQKRWLAAALEVGLPIESFLLVEWSLEHE